MTGLYTPQENPLALTSEERELIKHFRATTSEVRGMLSRVTAMMAGDCPNKERPKLTLINRHPKSFPSDKNSAIEGACHG